jgi:cyclophilin family peptidyl-prolyl cis-trans isomerase/HEAT repeat protein
MTMRPWRLPLAALILAGLSAGVTAIAPSAQQRAAPLRVETLELAVDRMLEARWYPREFPAASARADDQRMLQLALASQEVALRAVAVRSVGRFENPADLATLLPFLRDTDVGVQHEAINAIVMALRRGQNFQMQRAISAMAQMPPGDSATEELLTLDRYGGTRLPPTVEALSPRWLVRVIRAEPAAKLSPLRLKALHDLVRVGRLSMDANALEILIRQRDVDTNELWGAARFRCPDGPGMPPGTCGGPARFVVAQLLEPNDPSLEPILTHLMNDPIFQVRLAALRQLALAIPRTKTCQPILSTLLDYSETTVVRVEAIRLLDPLCEERDDIGARLSLLAADFSSRSGDPPWLAISAFEALPRFDAAQASRILGEQAATHLSAAVRRSAARVATALKEEATLKRLASDDDDNVKSEALGGLAAIRSRFTAECALRALDSKDYRLVATAAAALTRPLEPDKVALALVGTLTRLTKEGKDTSRETRLAILTRLDELARIKAGDVSMLQSYVEGDLAPLLKDFDPQVADAAASTLTMIRGTRQLAQPTHRPPQQPREDELRSLPSEATIVLANGDRIGLSLLSGEAPLTVARFVKLVQQQYYDNTEFFRISPLVVAQGGSPGGNDYSGDARFLRDEVGLARHARGAVGLMTHGRDTGNMQFFIDLLDQPGFDHEYTVFARVQESPLPRTGMRAVDALVEGSRIVQITLSGR